MSTIRINKLEDLSGNNSVTIPEINKSVGRFCGSSSIQPTKRLNGDPLQISDEWSNPLDGLPYWWNGSSWVALDANAKLLSQSLSNKTDDSKGTAMLGDRGSTLDKTLQAVSISVARSVLWPGYPGAALNSIISYVESVGGGVVSIPSGSFELETEVLTRDKVEVEGQGGATNGPATNLNWRGVGWGFRYAPTTFSHSCHSLRGFKLTGGNLEGNNGIRISDTFGYRLSDITVSGFVNGIGINLHNVLYWTEGTRFDRVTLYNNKINIACTRAASSSFDSFGYSSFRDVTISVLNGQTAVLIGDDSQNTGKHNLYNSWVDIHLWFEQGNGKGFHFGTAGQISDSNGIVRSEILGLASTYTGSLFSMTTPGGTGFLNWQGAFFNSQKEVNGGPLLNYGAAGPMKFRDVGQRGPGGPQAAAKWFRVCSMDDQEASFHGTVRMVPGFSGAANRTSKVDFVFGARGGATLYKPLFNASGEGFNGTGAGSGRFVLAKDATGKHFLYFYRPPFTNIAVFEYAYDPTLDFTQTIEYWDVVTDPTATAGLTVMWDSRFHAAQQSFVGDEMVFAGSREFFRFSGDGVTKVFNIPHGLVNSLGQATSPGWYSVAAVSGAATTAVIHSQDGNETNIVITFKTAPVVGSDNVILAAEWGRNRYNRNSRPIT